MRIDYATQNEEWIVRYQRLLQEAAALTTSATTASEGSNDRDDNGSSSIQEEAANLQAMIMTARAARIASLQCAILDCDEKASDGIDGGNADNDGGGDRPIQSQTADKASIELLLQHTQREMDIDASSASGPLRRLEELAFSAFSSPPTTDTSTTNVREHTIQKDDICSSLDIDAFFEEYPECIRSDWGTTTSSYDSDEDSDSDTDSDDDDDDDDSDDDDDDAKASSNHCRRRKRNGRDKKKRSSARSARTSQERSRPPDAEGTSEKENLNGPPLEESSSRPPLLAAHGAESDRRPKQSVTGNPYQKMGLPGRSADDTTNGPGQPLMQQPSQPRPDSSSWGQHYATAMPSTSNQGRSTVHQYSHPPTTAPHRPLSSHVSSNQLAWTDHRNQHNPFQTAREVAQAEHATPPPHRDSDRQQHQQHQGRQPHDHNDRHHDQHHRNGETGVGMPLGGAAPQQGHPPLPLQQYQQSNNPYATNRYEEPPQQQQQYQQPQPQPFHYSEEEFRGPTDSEDGLGGGGGPYIPDSLKRKFQPPKKNTETRTTGRPNKAVVPGKNGGVQIRSQGRCATGGNGPRPNASGDGGGGNNKNNNNSNGNVHDDEDELPEALQHLDKELVLKIQNEIMESGDTVTFDDIAGLADAKQTVQEVVCWPMKRPDLFTGLRRAPNGLLLYGPPGTGKTLIGKAIAHESGATFFSISSSSLTSKWIGEGEKLVRTLFAVAAYREPAVVFIDEIDSLLTQRKATENEASRRIKTEFLVQLDGTGTTGQGRVLVIGATNRPQELDEAARRRFVKRLYIPLPNEDDRRALLHVMLQRNNHQLTDADIGRLARETEGFSGADLKALCADAAMGPIRQLGDKALEVNVSDVPPISFKHFKRSLRGTRPSVAPGDLLQYEDWDKSYGSKRSDEVDDDSDDDQ